MLLIVIIENIFCKDGLVSLVLVEAFGIWEFLSWTKRKIWKNACIETDSLLVIQGLRSLFVLPFYFGWTISECKLLLQSLHQVSIIFVKRSANLVVHSLAKAANSKSDCVLTMVNFRASTLNVLNKDFLQKKKIEYIFRILFIMYSL